MRSSTRNSAGSICPMHSGRNIEGASGADYLHPLRLNEQAELLRQIGIASEVCWPAGTRQRAPAFAATSAPPSRRRGANTMLRHRKRRSFGVSGCAWSAPPNRPLHPLQPSQAGREQSVILRPRVHGESTRAKGKETKEAGYGEGAQ